MVEVGSSDVVVVVTDTSCRNSGRHRVQGDVVGPYFISVARK